MSQKRDTAIALHNLEFCRDKGVYDGSMVREIDEMGICSYNVLLEKWSGVPKMGLVLASSSEPPDDRTATGHEYWLKRQAIQVAAQLPENIQDAERVLAYAGQIVRGFLAPK